MESYRAEACYAYAVRGERMMSRTKQLAAAGIAGVFLATSLSVHAFGFRGGARTSIHAPPGCGFHGGGGGGGGGFHPGGPGGGQPIGAHPGGGVGQSSNGGGGGHSGGGGGHSSN